MNFILTGVGYALRFWNRLGRYRVHVIGVVGLVIGIGYVRHLYTSLERRLQHTRMELAASRLAESNLRAEADTTRALALVLGDSLTLYARLAEQLQDGERSRLHDADRKLKAETQAKAELETKVVRLEGMLETMATLSGDTLTASFHLRQEPYTLDARAVLTRAPRPSSLSVGVTLDSIPMTLRLTCKAGNGVRVAEAVVGAPAWAQVGIKAVQQDASICNPDPVPVVKGPSRTKWAVIGGSAALLLAKAFGN